MLPKEFHKRRAVFIIIIVSIAAVSAVFYLTDINRQNPFDAPENEGGPEPGPHPLSIEALRLGSYPGSDIIIEQTLEPTAIYNRYIVSYRSEGLKIYALLTVPKGKKPEPGWPVIVFNHGFIPPDEYKTTERYIAYVDAFARNGYIVFKSDYRGHGNSEGGATGGYGSNAYTIDVLNAVASIKKFSETDPGSIGMWGHSLGGHVTLRTMIATKDVKAGVIWAGVVGSYEDLLNNWRRSTGSVQQLPQTARRWRRDLVEQHGTPEKNPDFWNSLSATSYLQDISGPIQLHHGTADISVPVEFSEKLYELLKTAGKETELYLYPGDNHNISNSFSTAMNRSLTFFNRYLK